MDSLTRQAQNRQVSGAAQAEGKKCRKVCNPQKHGERGRRLSVVRKRHGDTRQNRLGLLALEGRLQFPRPIGMRPPNRHFPIGGNSTAIAIKAQTFVNRIIAPPYGRIAYALNCAALQCCGGGLRCGLCGSVQGECHSPLQMAQNQYR